MGSQQVLLDSNCCSWVAHKKTTTRLQNGRAGAIGLCTSQEGFLKGKCRTSELAVLTAFEAVQITALHQYIQSGLLVWKQHMQQEFKFTVKMADHNWKHAASWQWRHVGSCTYN